MLSPLLIPVANAQNLLNKQPLSSNPPPSFPYSIAMAPPTQHSLIGGSSFDEVIHRLQKLSIPSRPHSPSQLPPSITFDPPPHMGGQYSQEAPYAYPWPEYTKNSQEEYPAVIDSFAPRRTSFDLSPTSSASSDLDPSMSRTSFDAFFATRSRVIRLSNFPPPAASFLSAIFFQNRSIPLPATMWTLRDGPAPHEQECIWAVFKSHEDACVVLRSLSGLVMSVETALESDLEPFQKLRRFELRAPISSTSPTISLPPPSPANQHQQRFLRMTSSASDLHGFMQGVSQGDLSSNYMISSNPPNPRTNFRLGDWICGSSNCAAHNFGRNLACIGCGCLRPGNRTPSPQRQSSNSGMQSTRLASSPRFVSSPNQHLSNVTNFAHSPMSPMPSPNAYSNYPQGSHPHNPPPPMTHPVSAPKPPTPVHHLLTPSGRSFSVGGKVQNISTDPLSPCVLYWPDNEAFPEQGQIRPSITMGVPQPPILNTGNRGPIEHQPGDWICIKCNYLNWRRRKVCQTCYPYAEGNGDSISAAVQAERIALLTSVLAQGHSLPLPAPSNDTSSSSSPHPIRAQPLTPPQRKHSYIDISPPQVQPPVHRSQSHFELGAQYANCQPIYQTAGPRQPSFPFPTPPYTAQNQNTYTPAPLLPSFLQDLVQSPTVSPASTSPSSAELSFDEYDKVSHHQPHSRMSSGSSSHLAISNIWKFGGDESKGLSGFGLPNRHVLMNESRRGSQEVLRRSSQPGLP